MADATYDGTFDYPVSFVFTPTSGTAFGSQQAQVEEVTPGGTMLNTAKFTPLSGSNEGQEQSVAGVIPVKPFKIKWTYSFSAYQAALACLVAKSKGTLQVTYGSTHSESYSGQLLTEVTPGAVTSTNLRVGMLTFEGPSTPTLS